MDPDLFVELFVTGILLEKAFDFHKINIPRSLQISKLTNPMIVYNFPRKMEESNEYLSNLFRPLICMP